MARITFVPESIILKQSIICANSTLNEIFHLTCPKRSCEVAQEPLEAIFAKRTFTLWSLKWGIIRDRGHTSGSAGDSHERLRGTVDTKNPAWP